MMMRLLLLLFMVSSAIAQEEDPPRVATSSGEVVGAWTQTWEGGTLASFISIPYARPPVGELRFLPPEPADPWTEPLQATEFRGLCSQSVDQGEEDCLYLDVHAPQGAQDLPVMFYIHGGGLNSGSREEHFDPSFLGDFDVVLASVNYRLGPFGFLSVEGTSFTGNQGFRDQALALQWVADNIAAFGGDPNKVTIFGESAGSWSVMHQLLSPKVSGLFRGAIGHSGTPMGNLNHRYRTEEEDLAWGSSLTEAVACDQVGDVAGCLQSAPWDLLVAFPFEARGVVDGDMSDDPYLPDQPQTLLSNGDFNQVPLILGANSGESILYITDILNDPELLEVLDSDWEFYGPIYLFERVSADHVTDQDVEVSMAAKDFFFAPDSIIELDKLDKFVNMYTDALFQYGVHVMADYTSQFVPTYQYMLTYEGSLSYLNQTGVPTYGCDLGVAHVDDLQFVFKDSEDAAYAAWTELDDLVRRRICRMWANFARTLDPTPDGEQWDDLGDFAWSPTTSASHRYAQIGSDLSMEATQDYQDRMDFWRGQVDT